MTEILRLLLRRSPKPHGSYGVEGQCRGRPLLVQESWALGFTVRPDASPLRSLHVHLRQGRLGLGQPACHGPSGRR
jgi:hypothetical protein